MKVKTSITLAADLVNEIDHFSHEFDHNRSEFIETAVRVYIAQLKRDALNARDLAIINQEADRLNEEAADVMAYQIIP
jgi:metal-responsive CopG/Arc/MetJ family transcriptional regulator